MHLSRIEVRDLRNLASVSIHPVPGLNIIEGENASGKTSLLEAIHLLALARSFRTLKSHNLIRHGSESLTLFAELQDSAHHRLGLQRALDNSMEIRIDGMRIESRSSLASLLPIQLITPESISLLTGSPSERRNYIDWMMFHVEHQFHSLWGHYQRTLKQRNALLRSRDLSTLAYWSDQLVYHGVKIDALRKAVIKRLIPHIKHYAAQLLPHIELEFSYRQGWNRNASYSEAIEMTHETDIRMHYTTAGPHRADFVIKVGSDKVIEVFSRGQLKLLLCALKLGQMALLREETGKTPVVLIDDLTAELDKGHRNQLLVLLHQLDTQVFATTTDREHFDEHGWDDTKLFHVEHGEVKEVV